MADDATTLDYTTGDYTVVESAAAGPPGVGVPSGGTTGQALVKATNANYDTHWATPSTVAALDDLTDVTAPTPANGDGLVFNGTAWVNVDVATQAELNAHTGATGTAVHGLGTASTHNVPASGNAAVGEVVKGDDTRLTDNRTPTDNSVTSAKIVDGAIVNADINASAAIDLSKLASQADKTFVGNVSGGAAVPTAVTAANVLAALSGQAGADFAWNSHKLTGITAGTATGHAATYEQTAAGILTAQGDLLYASAANTPARLAKGTAYQGLRINAGATAPEWASGAMWMIGDLTPTGATADFTSIPATFRHLRLLITARSTRAAATNDLLYMQFNADATDANYNYNLDKSAAVTTSVKTRYVADLPAASSTSGQFTSVVIDVLDYASSQNKYWAGIWSKPDTSIAHIQSQWANTTAINQITLTVITGNFVSGSRVTLYGTAA